MECFIITSMRYHMRYHTFSLSLALLWGYFQRVTTRYHQIYKTNVYQYFFNKLTVVRGNALQIAPKPYQTKRKCTVTRVVNMSKWESVPL